MTVLRSLFALAGLLLVCGTAASAAPEASLSPSQDDAALHDVQFVGKRVGWAVGDRGVILKTTDGGQTWQPQSSGTDQALRSVCVLTDQVAWAAGGQPDGLDSTGAGVVVTTRDGGATWKPIGSSLMTPAFVVKFFDLDEGIAVCQPVAHAPTGLFRTADGGDTWQAVDGPSSEGWRTAVFLASDMGLLAGRGGKLSLFGDGQLIPAQLPSLGLRSIQALAVAGEETVWVVGDGGLLLKSDSGGVSWAPPPSQLPLDVRDLMDFSCVETRGAHVWVGGKPGSVVWHSPDGGVTWEKQATGQPLPLTSISFTNDTHGVAVGALCVVLRTEDGGRSWTAVRGADRRVALMALPARMTTSPSWAVTKYSGDLGYRSAVIGLSRQDAGSLARGSDDALRLAAGTLAAGGSAADVSWRLPLLVPGLDHDSGRLQADWMKRTEGKLPQVILNYLVREIRTWRPSVVLVDAPQPGDAVAALVHQAWQAAVTVAAESNRFHTQEELLLLPPWRVERVFERLPAGSTGHARIEAWEFLPRLATSVRLAAVESEGVLGIAPPARVERDAWNLVYPTPDPSAAPVNDFFAGMRFSPGSDCRRLLAPVLEEQLERRQRLIQKQRNFETFTQQSLSDTRVAGQLIAQLNQVTAELRDEEAAAVLRQLALDYQRHDHWDLAEQTRLELVRRFPQRPEAHDAMRWLVQSWTSLEFGYQRYRNRGLTGHQLTTDRELVQQRALSSPTNDPTLAEGTPIQLTSGAKPLRGTPARTKGVASIEDDYRRAAQLAEQLAQLSPRLHRSPEIQFPLAALRRHRGVFTQSDEIYREVQRLPGGDAWKSAAGRETWLTQATGATPQSFVRCKPTRQAPLLDGSLSDPVWQDSQELVLGGSAADGLVDGATRPFVLTAYDREYFYVAATLPRPAEVPFEEPRLAGRQHDADLTDGDRLRICLDVDRDYATWYTFEVDQKGRTREACWEQQSWNPQWFVATTSDETHWRVEAAIPLAAVVPHSISKNHVWGIGVTRVTPGVGLSSWTEPATLETRGEALGLLKFD